MNKDPRSGISISLQVPARDPDLYKHKATNETLLFLSRHRFDEFTIGELAAQTGNTKPAVTRAVDVLQASKLPRPEGRGIQRGLPF